MDFQLVETMSLFPAKTILGNTGVRAVDTGIEIDPVGAGRIYIGDIEAIEILNAFGWVNPIDSARDRVELEDLRAEVATLREQLRAHEDLRVTLDKLGMTTSLGDGASVSTRLETTAA